MELNADADQNTFISNINVLLNLRKAICHRHISYECLYDARKADSLHTSGAPSYNESAPEQTV